MLNSSNVLKWQITNVAAYRLIAAARKNINTPARKKYSSCLFTSEMHTVTNTHSLALPVPEIIGGIRKNWTVPGYAHAPFSPKILIVFCSDGPPECTGQI